MNWQKQEIEYLKNNYSITSDLELSKFLNKSPNAIRIKASRLNLKKFSKIYRTSLEITDEEEQVILGGLLGDLHCRKTKTSKNARLEGGHCIKQKDYLLYKSNLLKRLKWIIWEAKDGSYHYQSKCFPLLNKYCNMFYGQGKKIINLDILNKLNKLGLLIWYLDDGCFYKRDNITYLHTNGFTLDEQNIIKQWFESRWNISPKIKSWKDEKRYPGKIWYYLYFLTAQTKKFQNLFSDMYIPQSMMYKLAFNKSYLPKSHLWSSSCS